MRDDNWQPKSRNVSRTRARRDLFRALRWLARYNYHTTLAPPFAIRAYNAWASFQIKKAHKQPTPFEKAAVE